MYEGKVEISVSVNLLCRPLPKRSEYRRAGGVTEARADQNLAYITREQGNE